MPPAPRPFHRAWQRLVRRALWRMDVHPSATIAPTALIDRTWPKGVHIGANVTIDEEAVVLTHDLTRGLYLDTHIETGATPGTARHRAAGRAHRSVRHRTTWSRGRARRGAWPNGGRQPGPVGGGRHGRPVNCSIAGRRNRMVKIVLTRPFRSCSKRVANHSIDQVSADATMFRSGGSRAGDGRMRTGERRDVAFDGARSCADRRSHASAGFGAARGSSPNPLSGHRRTGAARAGTCRAL